LLLIIVGILILLSGVVFTLQGSGIVGPQGSFMFDNPTWVYQGVAAAIIGLVIAAGGVLLGRRRPGVGPAS
jgi:hypothetical protein